MEATSLPGGRGRILPASRRLLAALGDDRLVQQLRLGNALAFEVIYDRHHRGLLSFCRHMLGSREEAEDVLQQTFASAYDELATGRRELHLKAWLYTIARNKCLSVLRARREYATDEIERASLVGLADEVQHRQDLQDLVADLRELPEDQRAALVLSEVGDLSHADIAAVVGCDVQKVKSLVFQARSGLIERRQARETPCEEIQAQLSVLRGGSLRRGPLRRHLRACPGCQAYRDDVKRQRQMLAIALPVVPTLGLKESALAAAGLGASKAAIGGAGAAAPGGSALGGGGVAALAGKLGIAKVAVVAVASTAAVGGGVAVVARDDGERTSAPSQATPASPANGDPGVPGGRGASGLGGAATSEKRGERGRAGERGERGERGKRRGERRGEERGKRRRRGLAPSTGEHPGEQGRDNARERGRGLQRGLDGSQPRRSPPAPSPAPPSPQKRSTPTPKTPPPGGRRPGAGEGVPVPAPQPDARDNSGRGAPKADGSTAVALP